MKKFFANNPSENQTPGDFSSGVFFYLTGVIQCKKK